MCATHCGIRGSHDHLWMKTILDHPCCTKVLSFVMFLRKVHTVKFKSPSIWTNPHKHNPRNPGNTYENGARLMDLGVEYIALKNPALVKFFEQTIFNTFYVSQKADTIKIHFTNSEEATVFRLHLSGHLVRDRVYE
jgi:hypothetical protein